MPVGAAAGPSALTQPPKLFKNLYFSGIWMDLDLIIQVSRMVKSRSSVDESLLYYFPIAAVINYYKLGGLQQYKCIIL